MIHPIIHVNDSITRWERAAPFVIGAVLLVLTVVTTRAVVKKADERIRKEWQPVDPDQKSESHVIALAWVVDAAQIPVLLGTPLLGLFSLKHHIDVVLYTVVTVGGMIAFLVIYGMEHVNDYDAFSRIRYKGYRVSIVTGGGILVNLLCAAIAFVTK